MNSTTSPALMTANDRRAMRRGACSPKTWEEYGKPEVGTSYMAYHGWAGAYVHTPIGHLHIDRASQADEVFSAARQRSTVKHEALVVDDEVRARAVMASLADNQIHDLIVVGLWWQIACLLESVGLGAVVTEGGSRSEELCLSLRQGLRRLRPDLAARPAWKVGGNMRLTGVWPGMPGRPEDGYGPWVTLR